MEKEIEEAASGPVTVASENVTPAKENENILAAQKISEIVTESDGNTDVKQTEAAEQNMEISIASENTPNVEESTRNIISASGEAMESVESNAPTDQCQNISTHNDDFVIESNILIAPAPSPTRSVPTLTSTTSSPESCASKTSAKMSSTGLALLALYDSDEASDVHTVDEDSAKESDTDSVVEIKPNVNDYRTHTVEIDSDSSDSSSSDAENKTKYLTKLRKKIEKCIEVGDNDDEDDDDDDDDVGGKTRKRHPPVVKGELTLDDLPPIQDLQISVPAEDCIEFGRVHSVVDQLVLVGALPDSILLDLDTVLFLENGKRVLGEVFDVLGQVADPLYCVRFNNNKHIQQKGINVGDVVYVAPKTEYTQYVILSSLMKIRGSDASWENDIEPPPRYLDYSDDEQEREARLQRRKKNRSDTTTDDPAKRACTQSVSDQPDVDLTTTSEQCERRFGNRRGAGGGYQRPQRHSNTHSYQPHNTGSWHAYYNQPYRNGPAYNYRGFNAGPHQRMPRPMYNAPPRPYNPYAPPMHYMPPQRPPPSMYVMNPFAFRPPTLPQQQMSNSATSPPPPPPPPPQQQSEPEPPAPGSIN